MGQYFLSQKFGNKISWNWKRFHISIFDQKVNFRKLIFARKSNQKDQKWIFFQDISKFNLRSIIGTKMKYSRTYLFQFWRKNSNMSKNYGYHITWNIELQVWGGGATTIFRRIYRIFLCVQKLPNRKSVPKMTVIIIIMQVMFDFRLIKTCFLTTLTT